MNASDPKPLSRDGQQWFFDWLIQETGKVMHYQTEGRGGLPRTVKRHVMISKHLGKSARRMEKFGEEELEAGHTITALNRYFDAASTYANAQHVIFSNNDEKRFLHEASLRCFNVVRELSPYRIEHIEVPFEESVITGNLHLCPGEGSKGLVFYVPGCDATKEQYPHPYLNHAHQRGLHMFCIDGPGQGEANLRGIKLTVDNYEHAATAVLDYLVTRPEIDEDRLLLYGLSFGSYWATRVAIHERRFKAVALPWISWCEKYHLMNEESPRFKQLFMYLTGARSEVELDRLMDEMSVRDLVETIDYPTFVVVGEYDPRSPLDEVYELFDRLNCPAELWVFEDQSHRVSLTHPQSNTLPWLMDMHDLSLDWLCDRLAGKPLSKHHRVAYIPAGTGPESVNGDKRHWFEP